MISSADFDFIQRLLKDRSGLALTPDKAYLVITRTKPILEAHGLASLTDLVVRLRMMPHGPLVDEFVDCMTTNESLFFRDRTPFEALSQLMLPTLTKARGKDRPIKIWSAAASTGQEPYSIAMVVAENAMVLGGCSVEIFATDISPAALSRARAGVFTQFEVGRGVPPHYLARYFDRSEANRYVLKRVIREKVRFGERNLLQPFSDLGLFDIIFCRNVLIYFDKTTKANVLDRLANVLAPDGYLVLGGPETTHGLTSAFHRHPTWRSVYLPARGTSASFSKREPLVA